MGVVIRLQRAGARNRPFFRIVVADSRRSRDGAFIEKVGYYDPLPANDVISIDHPRVEEWIRNGAVPSVSVRQLIKHSLQRAQQTGPPAAGEPARAAVEEAGRASGESAVEPAAGE